MSKMRYFIHRLISFIKRLFGRKTKFVLTSEFKEVRDLLENTDKSLFLTGKAGTGKSTLLHWLTKETNIHKKCVILAPTGIAALNVGGRTIHSFFKFRLNIRPEWVKPSFERYDEFRDIDIIIIDEVSMVRADLMDCVDVALRKNLNIDKPFGGKQMFFVGDLYQLPPVLPKEDRPYIYGRYGGEHFFYAPAFTNFEYERRELTHVFRQGARETEFVNLLNNIRTGHVSFDDMVLLHRRHVSNTGSDNKSIVLTTKRDAADNINKDRLKHLRGNSFTYLCEATGTYKELLEKGSEDRKDSNLPAPELLELKEGAPVIMVKNDENRRWVNGSLGIVTGMSDNEVIVRIGGKNLSVERYKWEDKEGVGNDEDNVVGTFRQFPMQLAYAITIHKSQGKTFDSICINTATGAFAAGQVYVALSRCRTFKGIVLERGIEEKEIFSDARIDSFLKDGIAQKRSLNQVMNKEEIIIYAVNEHRKILIGYPKHGNGIIEERLVENLSYNNGNKLLLNGYCNASKGRRNFDVSKIQSIKII